MGSKNSTTRATQYTSVPTSTRTNTSTTQTTATTTVYKTVTNDKNNTSLISIFEHFILDILIMP